MRPLTLRFFQKQLLKKYETLSVQCRTDAEKEAGILKTQIRQVLQNEFTSKTVGEIRDLTARYNHMQRLAVAQKKHGEDWERELAAMKSDLDSLQKLIDQAEVPLFSPLSGREGSGVSALDGEDAHAS